MIEISTRKKRRSDLFRFWERGILKGEWYIKKETDDDAFS